MAKRPLPRPILAPQAPRPQRKPQGGGGGAQGLNQKIRKWAGYAGTGANAFFKALVGFGDYNVSRNSIMHPSQSLSSQVPMIKNSPGGMIVSHREYIGDVNSTVPFTPQTFALNPGLGQLFPWLSSLAQNFEEYEFRGVVLEYKSMSSDLNTASTTSNLGTVVMCTQYNPLDIVFPDKRTMENYQFACSGKPSEHIIHPIECKRAQNVDTHLYIRTGAALGNDADLRLYDLGNFTIATQGMPSAFTGSSIGELWVSYEVEFFKPKLTSTLGLTTAADQITSFGGFSNNPFENIGNVDPNNTCGCQVGAQSITFPPQCHGRFLISVYMNNATTGATNTQLNAFSPMSCTIVNQYYAVNSISQTSQSTPFTGVYFNSVNKIIVDVTPSPAGSSSSVSFTFTSTVANWASTINIVQVPPTFASYPYTY